MQAISLAYGPESQQFGELSLPLGNGPHPVVLLIHGGFWRAPYDLSLMTGLAQNLTRQGIAVWNIEYRRIGDSGGAWPGTFQDVACAADYLASIAPTYALDMSRVVAVGHSAGGHLALWLAARHRLAQDSPLYQPSPLPLQGVVSLAGVCDLAKAWQLNLDQGAVAELLGAGPDQAAERYADASPIALLPLGVPQVLIHGDTDDRVPLSISRAYADKASRAGDSVRFIELPNTDHFVLIDADAQVWTRTQSEIQSLLAIHSLDDDTLLDDDTR